VVSLLWDNWIIVAFIAPVVWATSCIIDVCFVSENIYRRPMDGTIISGLVSVIPCVYFLINIDSWAGISLTDAIPAVVAGVVYFLHSYYYFRALFCINDASGAETFISMSVLVVPVFAFLFLGERLDTIYYVAAIAALIGIVILIACHFKSINRRAIWNLSFAVVYISLCMVVQAWVFKKMDFQHGITLFCAGSFGTALLVCLFKPSQGKRIAGICRRYGPILIFAELIGILAVLMSHRATSISPSVTLVAIVECSLPVFIILLSLAVRTIPKRWYSISTDTHEALALQVSSLPAKLVSLSLISFAIVLVQH